MKIINIIKKILINVIFSSGKQVVSLETKTAVRACGFSYGGKLVMYTTDKTMGFPCEISIFDITDPSQIGKRFLKNNWI